MKRILNLNSVATPWLQASAVCGIGLPAACLVAARLLEAFGVSGRALRTAALGSAGLGGLLLALLLVLVVLEQVQDRTLERAFFRQQARRLPADHGYYECQYCGNRRLQPADRRCPVCGRAVEP
jgi:hypothetical protein